MDGVVEAPQPRRRRLRGDLVPGGDSPQQRREQLHLAHEPRAGEEMLVRTLDPDVGVGGEHGVDDLRPGVCDESGEVVGGIGDLRRLPAGDPADRRPRGIGPVREGHEDVGPGERAVDRRRREAPQPHVVERLLPPGEKAGGDPAGRRTAVDLGEVASAVALGVVGRQASLVVEGPVDVVDHRDRSSELGGHRVPWLQGGHVERMTGDVGVHRGPADLRDRGEAFGGRDGEGDPADEEREHGQTGVHVGRRDLGPRGADDPATLLGVLDERDVEVLLGATDDLLDRDRVQPGHRSAREGCQTKRTIHGPTVCRGHHRSGEGHTGRGPGVTASVTTLLV